MSIEVVKKRKIDTEKGKLVGIGAENRVYQSLDPDEVIKVFRGNVVDGKDEYVITNDKSVQEHIRRQIIVQHILGKILHLLLPDSIPDRSKLFSKYFPQFSQEKVAGSFRGDEVKPLLKEVDVVHTGSQRFKIKSSTEVVGVTEDTLESDESWRVSINELSKSLRDISVGIDTQNSEQNFLKTTDGKYKYIDSFTILNPDNLIADLRRVSGDNSTIRPWIDRLEKVLGSQ